VTKPLPTREYAAIDALTEETEQSASAQGSPTGDRTRHTLPSGLIHDLRTPLNQIIGYSEMLAEQEEGREDLVPDLHKICTAGRQLLALINTRFQPLNPPASDAVWEGAALTAISGAAGATLNGDALGTSGTPSAPAPPQTEQAGPAADDMGTAEEQPASGSSQGLLLVVDDDAMNRDVLSRHLKRQGYDVAMAANGHAALEAVRAQAFDLVLLDIMMPEMDGYEVLLQLKADEALRHIPIIMISALSALDSVVRCIEMGADDYLPKPFNPTLLKARIGACLEKKRGHDHATKLFEQLQQNYRRLQDLEKLRDDLTHMIVHDLRTPLTSVMAGMQSLEAVGDLNETQQEMLGIAVDGGQTLLGMINDLLDVDKMESGSLQLDYALLSAAELAASAVSQVALLAESSHLTLGPQIAADLPPFQGDEDKLRRTLVNLLGNAMKFTRAGGMVTVAVRQADDGRSLLFSVSDTGEGIPAEAFERIFEKFGQVDSRQGGRKMSTGLGLTFCKLAVEAHGGRIGVESVPGKGSTFSFTIPLASR
jgi:two-component system sensor histidine kinase/response regulator